MRRERRLIIDPAIGTHAGVFTFLADQSAGERGKRSARRFAVFFQIFFVQPRRVAAVQTLNDNFGVENDDTHATRRYEQLFSQRRSGARSS